MGWSAEWDELEGMESAVGGSVHWGGPRRRRRERRKEEEELEVSQEKQQPHR